MARWLLGSAVIAYWLSVGSLEELDRRGHSCHTASVLNTNFRKPFQSDCGDMKAGAATAAFFILGRDSHHFPRPISHSLAITSSRRAEFFV